MTQHSMESSNKRDGEHLTWEWAVAQPRWAAHHDWKCNTVMARRESGA